MVNIATSLKNRSTETIAVDSILADGSDGFMTILEDLSFTYIILFTLLGILHTL